MKFSEMVKILQEKEKGYIVLINSGSFYIARGKDAIVLNKELDLKLTCMEKEVCKAGFPKVALEKYVKILKRKRYAFIVYNFDRNLNKLEIITRYEGKIKSLGKEEKRDCIMCKMGTGTEYKQSMYNMLRKILYLSKINNHKIIEILNEIDAELNTQRIYARIMKNNKWIDERKFKIIMEQIYEIGKILGGLLKYYGKMDKK